MRVVREDAWDERGFQPEEAAEWRAAGFRADPAYLIRSLGATPFVGRHLLRVLGDQDAVVEAVERAVIRAPNQRPRSGAEVTALLDGLVMMTACGFRLDEAAVWLNHGWDAQEAAHWHEAGFGPASARSWRDAGFAPMDAVPWKRDLFGSKQAAQWQQLGATPERARAVAKSITEAHVDIADALRLLEAGLTLDEVLAGERSVVDVRMSSSTKELVAVTKDDLLAAAGQLVRAGTASALVRQLRSAADAGSREVEPKVIAETVRVLRSLDAHGALGSPLLARIVVSRFERALDACAAANAPV
jgi:hypothetical protein